MLSTNKNALDILENNINNIKYAYLASNKHSRAISILETRKLYYSIT
jgi:hypothetical protein